MDKMEDLRDKTIKRLEYSYAHGEISLEELEKRIELAVNTPLKEELERLVSDLKPEEVKEIPYNDGQSEETIMGVLSGIQRKGQWSPARFTKIFVFMGGVELDFSKAELKPGVTEFEFFCALGGIEVKVPEGINVDVSGMPLLGGIENRLSSDSHPGNPTIRLHGTVVMGGLEIKPSKKKKRR